MKPTLFNLSRRECSQLRLPEPEKRMDFIERKRQKYGWGNYDILYVRCAQGFFLRLSDNTLWHDKGMYVNETIPLSMLKNLSYLLSKNELSFRYVHNHSEKYTMNPRKYLGRLQAFVRKQSEYLLVMSMIEKAPPEQLVSILEMAKSLSCYFDVRKQVYARISSHPDLIPTLDFTERNTVDAWRDTLSVPNANVDIIQKEIERVERLWSDTL